MHDLGGKSPAEKFIIVLDIGTRKTTEITIDRIVDIPSMKKVFVFIKGERIELAQLSGDNYDTPSEWTNADVIAAVKAHYNIA